MCPAVNLLAAQEDELCDLEYLEFEVGTEHLILDALRVGPKERKREVGRKEGRGGGRRRGRREGRKA